MLKVMLLGAALLLAGPALAQTTTDTTGTNDTTGTATTSDTEAATLRDAATTPRSGDTDAGAARTATPSAPASYPPCTRTVRDRCRQRGGR